MRRARRQDERDRLAALLAEMEAAGVTVTDEDTAAVETALAEAIQAARERGDQPPS